jgi:hypothetical protein
MNKPVTVKKVVIETRDKTKIPSIIVEGKEHKSYNFLPAAILFMEEADEVKAGQVIVKIPRVLGQAKRYLQVVCHVLPNYLKQETRVILLLFLKLTV